MKVFRVPRGQGFGLRCLALDMGFKAQSLGSKRPCPSPQYSFFLGAADYTEHLSSRVGAFCQEAHILTMVNVQGTLLISSAHTTQRKCQFAHHAHGRCFSCRISSQYFAILCSTRMPLLGVQI